VIFWQITTLPLGWIDQKEITQLLKDIKGKKKFLKKLFLPTEPFVINECIHS
jgi:hypothetical protein